MGTKAHTQTRDGETNTPPHTEATGPKKGRGGLPLVLHHPRAAYFGIWTTHTWIYWINLNNHSMPESFGFLSIYAILAIFLIAVVIVYRNRIWDSRDDRFSPLMAGLGILSTLLVTSPIAGALPWAPVAGIIIGGIVLGSCYLQWGVFFSRLDIRSAVACIFVAYAAGSLVKGILMLLPLPVGIAIACLLPVLSVFWGRKALSADVPCATPRMLYSHGSLESLWKVGVCVATYSIAISFLNTTTGHSSNLIAVELGHILEICIAGAILFWVFRHNGSFGFAQLWRLVLLFLATVLVFVCLFSDSPIIDALIGVVVSSIVMFFWLLLADVAHHSDLHPFCVFGAGWVVYALGLYAGSVVARLSDFSALTPTVAIVLLYVLSLVMVFCLETRDPDMQRIFQDLETAAPEVEDFSRIDQRCEVIGHERGLTSREVEIMQLICKGRSKAYIAETLFISESTVRGHSQKLYAKLDVHSKRELQDLVGL